LKKLKKLKKSKKSKKKLKNLFFPLKKLEKFKLEKEKMHRDFSIERLELNERIEILTSELEKELLNFEQSKQNFELETNENAYKRLKEQLEASSKSEYNLIEELQKYDEQIKSYEIQTKNYEKKLNLQEEKHMKTIENYKKKTEELERNLAENAEEKKNQYKLEAKLSEIKEEYEGKIKENANVIKSLEKLKENDMQKILVLAGENKKLSQNIEKLKQVILGLENGKNEMEERIKDTIEEYEEKMIEMSNLRTERARTDFVGNQKVN